MSLMQSIRLLLSTVVLMVTTSLSQAATPSYDPQVGTPHGLPALPVLAAIPASGAYSVTVTDTLLPPSADSPASRQVDTTLATLPVDSVALHRLNDSIRTAAGVHAPVKPRFVPNPQRALWLSLVFPGAGQIYNRKLWKLPIIYGGFLGCTYALMWNQQMYRDYSQAYLDIMDDDPTTNSYLDMLPPRYDITGKEEQFKAVFKRKKDYFRRYRDLSAFCFIGVYLLAVVDAYVDAQLSEFDISPDLSLGLAPAVMTTDPAPGSRRSTSYGIGCSLRF